MRRIWQFFREYYLFGGALVAACAAFGLELAGQHTAAHWLLGAATLLELLPLLQGMWQDLRTGTYGVDILAATAILTSVLMKEYWAGLVIVLMLTGGEALEDYADRRASRELDALLDHAPQKAHVLRGRKVLDVNVKEITVGDKIIIRPGELVPVDAVILEGQADFDEASLTGESLPQAHNPADTILSGSICIDGAITARAVRTAADSQYQQIIKLVQSASQSQTPFVRLADRYSVPFTLVSFGIAIAAWLISGQSLRFLEVLVVATPCPLILAAPIAVISGMSRATKQGIIIKTGGALERLAQAQSFAFDKTGTLTHGRLTVDSVKTFNGFKRDQVLGMAASLEHNSNHVLAQAIVAKAQSQQLKMTKVKHIVEVAGKGIQAQMGANTILVGRLAFLQENDISVPAAVDAKNMEQIFAAVAIDGHFAGIIICKDELRSEAQSTITQLRRLGVRHFLMVTGDNKTVAKGIAKQVGIKQVVAEALPADKLAAIEAVASRPVVFVGDGINDAPVLTASDVGIALGARGSTAASQSADVVVMLDDLGHVGSAVAIAKRTFFIARQSILVGIGMSVVLMLIFSTGKFQPVYGALIQELVDVVVIFNALRAHVNPARNESK